MVRGRRTDMETSTADKTIARADLITTVVIFTVALAYTVVAFRFPGDAKIVPATLGVVALIVIGIQLMSRWVHVLTKFVGELDLNEEDRAIFEDSASRRRLLEVSLSLIMVPVLVGVVGLPIALPIYVALFMLYQKVKLWTVALSTVVIAMASYGLLVVMLSWPLNDGLLGQYL
jgi:hypothetical protein